MPEDATKSQEFAPVEALLTNIGIAPEQRIATVLNPPRMGAKAVIQLDRVWLDMDEARDLRNWLNRALGEVP